MNDKQDSDRGTDLLLWLSLALSIGVGLFLLWALPGVRQVRTIPYSQFLDLLDHGKVEQVMVGETALTGTLSEALPNGLRTFETVRVAPDIARDLSARHIPFSGVTESGWASGIVGWFGWILILFAVWSLAGLSGMRTGDGLLSIGRSKAKLFAETDISIRFDDVAGVDEAKEELREVVDFLQNPGEFSRLGAHVPKGDPAGRPARNRQDAAGQGRRRRSQGSLHIHQWVGIRRDVRRGRGRQGAGPVHARPFPNTGDHLHRRA